MSAPSRKTIFYKRLVTVRIGKSGITEGLLEEIKRNLKIHGYVKVKMLKNYREAFKPDRFEVAKEIAQKVGAELVGVRGYTFILKYKPKKG